MSASPGDSGPRRPYYAELRLHENERVRRIRDEVYSRLGSPADYSKRTPHVTLHPGFSCGPRGHSAAVGLAVHAVDRRVSISGLSFWPSRSEPHVVKLDLGTDFGVIRQAVEAAALADGGTVDSDPVPAHVTLLSTEDGRRPPVGPRRLRTLSGEYGGWTATVAACHVKRR